MNEEVGSVGPFTVYRRAFEVEIRIADATPVGPPMLLTVEEADALAALIHQAALEVRAAVEANEFVRGKASR